MTNRSGTVLAASICSMALIAGCGAKHEGAQAEPSQQHAEHVNNEIFSLTGGWQCKLPMKAAPGFFVRSYYFGRDNVFATAGKDGDATVLVAGAYQLSGDQQQLRWIEGTLAAFAPSGATLQDWQVSQPGGEVIRSSFRDRQTSVRITDANNIVLRSTSITSGPGGEVTTPNPISDVPCVRSVDALTEQAWRDVPRPLIAQMLSLYPMNPVPQFIPSQQAPDGIVPFSSAQPATATPSPRAEVGDATQVAEAEAVDAVVRLNAAIAAHQAVRGCEGGLQLLLASKNSISQYFEYAEQFKSHQPSRLKYLKLAAERANAAASRGKGTACNP